MFLALRELVFARGRFALMGSVVALIAILMVLLSGLSVGLVNDGVSGLKKLPVSAFSFQKGTSTDGAFSRSTVDVSVAETWRGRSGVEDAAPFGNTLVNAKTDSGVDIDLALFGVEPGSFVAPQATNGEKLSDRGTVLLGQTAEEAGVRIGDTVVVDQLETPLKVTGFLDGQHTFGHVDVGYLDLRTWQEIRAGVRQGEEVPAHVYDQVTAIALKGDGIDLAAGDEALETKSLTLEESFGASPGYSAETSTLDLIQVFLYAISALVVGAFFTVVTIQRKHEIAVLRAMGSSTGRLLRDSLAQSLILLVAASAVGVGLGVAMGAAISGAPMPFQLDFGSIGAATAGLIVLGVIGAGVAVLRITRVDPLTALGGSR
ncbi:putative ABC transport system permease protein [Lentzea fradiae]|uniref:Putative ABC transport system permease protein n=1 Tax=Lentzea fradiae TaxID=200378 RepID=A0A1G7QFF2_9PSEU|nr:ABC transporter permease [Lentzea fradiae]SDF97198.1 putative ABC transport system permease protein [Lentzea fradiae]